MSDNVKSREMSCSANVNTGSQKLRKNGSPGMGKPTGPLRATLPVSLMGQAAVLESGTKSSANTSQVSSPRVKASPRTSPTSKPTSSGNRSRQSPWRIGQWSPIPKVEEIVDKEVALVPLGCSSIRRTASLDAIYLKGHWPREGFFKRLFVDKATQTPDEWQEDRRLTLRSMEASPSRADSRQKQQQRLNVPILGSVSSRVAASTNTEFSDEETAADSSVLRSRAIPVPSRSAEQQMPRVRNSVEGFSTEIERLVLTGTQDTATRNVREATPDGHRAPIAELFKVALFRSVNTQTPVPNSTTSSGSSTPSGSSSPFLLGPLDPVNNLSSTSDNQGSVLGTSPHVSRFLSREPPDGCEKVPLKAAEESRRISGDMGISAYGPLKPNNMFVLQSSSSSAFCPLYKPVALKSSSSSQLCSTKPESVIADTLDRSSSVPPEWPSSPVQNPLSPFAE